jgi:hypothetical protein
VATSIHLPQPLRDAVDRRAGRLGISRNRLIISVLEREVGRDAHWSAGFLERLSDIDPEEAREIEEALRSIGRSNAPGTPR